MTLPPSNPIVQLGNPILRAIAAPVSLPLSPALQATVRQMQALMESHAGVGIAAPQVGVSLQIIIVASRPTLRYPTAPSMPPLPMINPCIVERSPNQVTGWEGCLSVPGLRGSVPRFQAVTVEYCDLAGRFHCQSFDGFVARIIQHECDHLLGKVFLDHINSEQVMSESDYFKQEEWGPVAG
ncbi:peptide deformylase [Lyngbya confervoides]|uniref:Peptide deformylase n=1 Tax=Lyngbya confervoides BDU141951 TaxID=1574623 RepID=A0ABD4T4S4_9CYAN|nr:peptide deformylase [Lyngbya confervoides]MCM1983460.1 peptide deformylase [Lyngbya confervoides BDU141951]